MDFCLLIEVIGGAGSVVSIGNEELVVLPDEQHRHEWNLLQDLYELGADILVRLRQQLCMRGAQYILGFEFFDMVAVLFELDRDIRNRLRAKNELKVFFCSSDVLFRNFRRPLDFLHWYMGLFWLGTLISLIPRPKSAGTK